MGKTRFERMCDKMQTVTTEMTYFYSLLGSLCSMFEWEGLPVEQRHLEEYLHINASFGVQPSDAVPEGYIFVPEPSRDGIPMLDQFAEGMHVHGVTLGGGHELDGYLDRDVCICYNNSMHVPDWDMSITASYLTAVDRAILVNTRLSGFAPILGAQDSKTHKELESILDQLLGGEVKVFKDMETEPLLQPQAAPIYSLELTKPERIQSVQYHSQLWMDLLRRFYAKFGIDIQETNKRAQVSLDEANSLDAYSWILPLDMLRQREEFCEHARRLWGVDWSVRFSPLWQQEYDKYVRITEEVSTDESADDGGDTGVSGQSAAGDDDLSE